MLYEPRKINSSSIHREALGLGKLEMCKGYEYGELIFFAVMFLIIFIPHMIAIRKLHHPLVGFIISCVQNIYFTYTFISIFCWAKNGKASPGFIPILGAVLIPASVIMNYFIYYRRNNGRKPTPVTKFRRKMFFDYSLGKKQLKEETKLKVMSIPKNENPDDFLMNILKESIYGPPKIFLRSYYSDKKGIFVFVPYHTWEPISTPIFDINRSKIMILKFTHYFQLTEELQNKVRIYVNGVKFVHHEYFGVDFDESKCSLKEANQAGNLHQTMVISNGSLLMSFLNSKFGFFIYIISHIFGLSTFFDDLFGMQVSTTEIDTKRLLSNDNSLRNERYKADANGGVDIEQPPKDPKHLREFARYFISIGMIRPMTRNNQQDQDHEENSDKPKKKKKKDKKEKKENEELLGVDQPAFPPPSQAPDSEDVELQDISTVNPYTNPYEDDY
ncbi:hypothetical protein TVAG_453870 [Trichomonas vaginalis G3]|uniref:Uncharacterized protein n=1 Tax=Trichomonas vaginalis (strain ATCC PRA-98 / G3) TaxID=412133 RepID=A2DPW3_TRIV3|nr:hypothetical protein TVAGG3_0552330 [Trichomonas vaginalis G3]EAY17559.1 hypothetical protein TVAG_453870 [Trichomonas vaginalis G3]KAI5520603.1 hypothetical protein TVAGG3_0552330 [Trichomonas vaginalis G3]|eukprot:XP_001329694.1 hypothetical protein [Trichomonas vaginalis G3]